VTVKEQIDQDLKQAMLAGDKTLVMTLRGLKGAILNVEVADGLRETGLPDERVIDLLVKEAKKRKESADLYRQGGSEEKASAELQEKVVIEKYLPAQMDEKEISTIVDQVIQDQGAHGMQMMGQVIGAVKQKTGASADGAVVARIVKEKLQ
jgi:uncharacterized protein